MGNKFLNKAEFCHYPRQEGAKRSPRGQVALEVSLAFVLIVVLLGGIINIWLWSNKQIVERQLSYNATRVAAGTSTNTYKLNDPEGGHPWPVYEPEQLTENMVIRLPYENSPGSE